MSTIETYKFYSSETGVKQDDHVRVTRIAESLEHGWNNSWDRPMDKYVNCICQVVSDPSDINGVKLSTKNGPTRFRFPVFVLEKVDPSTPLHNDPNKYDCTKYFEEGDLVLVTRKAKSYEKGWSTGWVSGMNQFIGKVLSVRRDDGKRSGVQLNTANYTYPGRHYYWFPNFVLEKVTEYEIRTRDLETMTP